MKISKKEYAEFLEWKEKQKIEVDDKEWEEFMAYKTPRPIYEKSQSSGPMNYQDGDSRDIYNTGGL